MPTATDLVTDLPADFEVFGQAVATSMADLLGGTSGQVLAKNSNTDMDFVWVTSDDANAIQNTIVDAKGDLIAATAADTPARLAVGTNGQLLSADSTAATGLAWTNGAKVTSYTPTWGVASGTAPVLGNGVLTGAYTRVGDLVYFRVQLQIGSTTTTGVGAYTFTLPIAMTGASNGIAGDAASLDQGVAWYVGFTPYSVQNGYTDKFTLNNAANVTMSNTSPYTIGSGDVIYAWGVYYV